MVATLAPPPAHTHRWICGPPSAGGVVGRCDCGAERVFDADGLRLSDPLRRSHARPVRRGWPCGHEKNDRNSITPGASTTPRCRTCYNAAARARYRERADVARASAIASYYRHRPARLAQKQRSHRENRAAENAQRRERHHRNRAAENGRRRERRAARTPAQVELDRKRAHDAYLRRKARALGAAA